MAKKSSVKIRGIGNVRDNLLKVINNSIKDKSFLDDVGTLAADQIRNRTRGRLEEYKQPDLKDSTTKRRKALIGAGNALDQRLSRPKQSNLTLSGQLLASITHRVNQTQASISLFLNNQRQPYTGVRGKPLENKSNNEIKSSLEKLGRKFLFVSVKLKAQLESKITQQIRRNLSTYNRIRRKLSLK